MSLVDAISSFSTGTYTVTRRAAGTYVDGVLVLGSSSTFTIDACVQPATGRQIRVLPEGQRSDETIAIWTTTALRTRDAAGAADEISYKGVTFVVANVKQWEAFGGDASGDHYEVLAGKKTAP